MNSKSYVIALIVVILAVAAGYFAVKGKQSKSEMSVSTTNETERVQNVMRNTASGSSSTIKNENVVASSSAAGSSSASERGQSMVKESVDYTDNGFVPNIINIKIGTSVTWINKTGSLMWVASNPHPVHTDLPGFDQLSSIGKDGTYTYTFEKVGNWGYHNHMLPSDTGVVKVTQ
ncbi:hypothetical protein M1271_01625 [Patescibacteria group bacterium]|nr:hypothetical protein [Patescibacteria group bacterium]MCL5798070.1 hypothetical protein [Patescibacteria group bacterium]